MYKVVIDAGHGGKDLGATSESRKEKDDVLKLSLLIAEELRDCGINVFLTRDDDTFLSLKERANFANDLGADLFVSIHRNSAPVVSEGVEVWVNSNRPKKSVELGQNILDAMLKTFPISRGLNYGYPGKPDQNFAVNRLTNMASALVEVGFINSENDNTLFDEELENIAKDIAGAILKTLKVDCGESNIEGTLTIKNGVWNVRSAPNDGAKIVGKVYQGQSFSYTDEENGWYKIPLGWVSGQGVILSDLDDTQTTYAPLSRERHEGYPEYTPAHYPSAQPPERPRPSKPQESTQKVIKIAPGVWNVREKPNGNKIITVVFGGQYYPYTEKKDDWYKIPMGWVSGKGAMGADFPENAQFIRLKPGHWNVRRTPGLSGEIVKVINGGQIVEYFSQHNGWFKLKDGYISQRAIY